MKLSVFLFHMEVTDVLCFYRPRSGEMKKEQTTHITYGNIEVL